MKQFRVTIACENAAFDDDAVEEVARILYDIADKIGENSSGRVRDINGNDVGFWTFGVGSI